MNNTMVSMEDLKTLLHAADNTAESSRTVHSAGNLWNEDG